MNSLGESEHLSAHYLGLCDYWDVRAQQEELQRQRQESRIGDLILYCEHYPTITFGKRVSADESQSVRRTEGLSQCLFADIKRGGLTTYHGPGQLMIYPVFSLRDRGLGIRHFIELVLMNLARVVGKAGVEVEVNMEKPGLWLASDPKAKLGFVGLQASSGVTNHGFAININNDLEPFSHFNTCGESGIRVTSLKVCLGFEIPLDRFASDVHARLSSVFGD